MVANIECSNRVSSVPGQGDIHMLVQDWKRRHFFVHQMLSCYIIPCTWSYRLLGLLCREIRKVNKLLTSWLDINTSKYNGPFSHVLHKLLKKSNVAHNSVLFRYVNDKQKWRSQQINISKEKTNDINKQNQTTLWPTIENAFGIHAGKVKSRLHHAGKNQPWMEYKKRFGESSATCLKPSQKKKKKEVVTMEKQNALQHPVFPRRHRP